MGSRRGQGVARRLREPDRMAARLEMEANFVRDFEIVHRHEDSGVGPAVRPPESRNPAIFGLNARDAHVPRIAPFAETPAKPRLTPVHGVRMAPARNHCGVRPVVTGYGHGARCSAQLWIIRIRAAAREERAQKSSSLQVDFSVAASVLKSCSPPSSRRFKFSRAKSPIEFPGLALSKTVREQQNLFSGRTGLQTE